MKEARVFANKKLNGLTKALKSLQHIQDPDLLHKVRVEIKQIKTLINLIGFSVKGYKSHRHYIPFRNIFRQAGVIRQPGVMYKLLLRHQINGVADSDIPRSNKIDRLSAAFQKETPQLIAMVKAHGKKLLKHAEEVPQSRAKKYLRKKRNELERLLFPTFSNKSLHKARKTIKELIYLQWINGKKRPGDFLTNAENIIGQWHDKQMLLAIVKKKKAVDEIQKLDAACHTDLTSLKKLIADHYN
ncbi:MAG: CHAD domain-containing protein [Cyclobacteriaceae bacterium]|nr:CHAD domain-containing protein [Cyclobacteriaceae bacterium]